jgi:transposase
MTNLFIECWLTHKNPGMNWEILQGRPSMQPKHIFSVGLDVDDKQFHGFSICVSTGEIENFCSPPNSVALIKRLRKICDDPSKLKICYEAGYLGFSLYRDLVKAGFQCDVIAPSQIPEKRGDKVKTDRLDAEKLARYYLGGFLTIVTVPSLEQEMDRDLVRSRKFHVEQLTALKLHIRSQTRRLGWCFKSESKNSWSAQYVNWLKTQIKNLDSGSVKFNFEMLLSQFENLLRTIESYNKQIAELCEKPAYKETVKALKTYRGVSELTAVLLCTELGDMRRFSHPKQVTSYAGLDIIERSSGGREKSFHLRKTATNM